MLFAFAACGNDDSQDSGKIDHAGRIRYQEYWNGTLGNLAMVYVSGQYAAKALGSGDSVQASQILEYAQKFADNAKDAALSPLDRWNTDGSNVGSELFEASGKLSDVMMKLRGFVYDQRPSEASDATDDIQEAASDINDATQDARESYVKMGGKSSDLESLQSKEQSALIALRSVTAHSQ
ncbi:MAG TPA: hypothetical protein VJP76_08655 [Candidatus Tumulicola sp.]|nr:hypothetical protein [Candidatus Tumulicola sp.]